MRKSFVSILLSASLSLAPTRANAQLFDNGTFLMMFPIVVALIAAAQANGNSSGGMSGGVSLRNLRTVSLLAPLNDGTKKLKPEQAASMLKSPVVSVEDRVIIANSIMVNVMRTRFWMDRNYAFGMLNIDALTPSEYSIKDEIVKSFKSNGVKMTGVQENIIEQMSQALEFELAIRKLGVPADNVRNEIIAGYFLALSSSTQKLEEGQRTKVLQSALNSLSKISSSVFKGVTDVIADETQKLNLDKTYQSFSMTSVQYMPPWMLGAYSGMAGMLGTIISLMVFDDQVHNLVQSLGYEPYDLSVMMSELLAVPTAIGVTSAFSYKAILARVLKPKIDSAAHTVLQKACELHLNKTAALP